jgi:acyl-CoA thioesterase-1
VKTRTTALIGLTALTFLAGATGAAAQTTPTTYVAFGDSITEGFGDNPNRAEQGWPPRLESLLQARGATAEVRNEGLGGETTQEGVSRINRVIQEGDDVLLLMEGTNDINARISNETIAFNLDRIAERAEARGLSVVHATIIPRLGSAAYDRTNQVTGAFNGMIRELAWAEERKLADPFEVLFHLTPNFAQYYVGGSDKLHPNAAGYDLIARVFADVLTNVDNVPPVTGLLEPRDDAQRVSPAAPVQIDLYDFGAGIDVASVRLLINGTVVETPVTGGPRKVEIRYTPQQPWRGVIKVGLRARDTATPPNQVEDMEVVQFVTAGTTFLNGDIDRDGRVDGVDLLAFAPTFGARRSDQRFRTFGDLNDDGLINGADLAILASNFGKSSF